MTNRLNADGHLTEVILDEVPEGEYRMTDAEAPSPHSRRDLGTSNKALYFEEMSPCRSFVMSFDQIIGSLDRGNDYKWKVEMKLNTVHFYELESNLYKTREEAQFAVLGWGSKICQAQILIRAANQMERPQHRKD